MIKHYKPASSQDDDGTMPENVADFANRVIGRKIVSAEQREVNVSTKDLYYVSNNVGLVLTLDDGTKFAVQDTADCCAYTELETFIFNPDKIDNVITSVETYDGYTQWKVLADGQDVLTMMVGWSPGNPFYYGYGFSFKVIKVD